MNILKHPNGRTGINFERVINYDLIDEPSCFMIIFYVCRDIDVEQITWGFDTIEQRQQFVDKFL